jgi:tetraacyldisaccharide 4'-kinase
MNPVRRKIELIMDENTGSSVFSFSTLLSLFSWGYEGLVRTRNFLYQSGFFQVRKLPCRVISIGNICVGGTGKTPTTLYTAELLKNMGYKVCIISRGYKGRAEKNGGIVSDGGTILMDVNEAGDEPFMMAGLLKETPVIVGRDRFGAGMKAVRRFAPDVVLLDDGFQHRKLFRDLDMVLLDYRKPLGNRRLLPRGRLREPPEALARSHALVFTRSGDEESREREKHLSAIGLTRNKRCFFARHEPFLERVMEKDGNPSQIVDPDGLNRLQGKRVFAFSGIADNRSFLNTLDHYCGGVGGYMEFPDHHPYGKKDFSAISRAALAMEADLIVTTQKDAVKIPGHIKWPAQFGVMGIKISLGEDEDDFRAFLLEFLMNKEEDIHHV